MFNSPQFIKSNCSLAASVSGLSSLLLPIYPFPFLLSASSPCCVSRADGCCRRWRWLCVHVFVYVYACECFARPNTDQLCRRSHVHPLWQDTCIQTCMCRTYIRHRTEPDTHLQTHRYVHTFSHQWGNPCLSVSSLLSVPLRLDSHRNSVWSWLLPCHSHMHACTATNTLLLCEICSKGNPWWENWQQA